MQSLPDHLTIEDLEEDCSYSWPGIGFPLAEVDNMGALIRRAIASAREQLGEH